MPTRLMRRAKMILMAAEGDQDKTSAGSGKQHLVAAMDTHFISRTGAEVDDGRIEVVAHLRQSSAVVG